MASVAGILPNVRDPMSKAVYREYDQEALEFQYGPRRAVPNTDEVLARWVANSEAYYAESDCERDIAYGPRAEETLDIFKPANPDGAPVLIFIHGGYWRALDKKDHAFLPIKCQRIRILSRLGSRAINKFGCL